MHVVCCGAVHVKDSSGILAQMIIALACLNRDLRGVRVDALGRDS